MRVRGTAWARTVGLLGVAGVSAVYFLNMPFYSGSSLWSTASWRMEHGRLSVHWGTVPHHEGFYIAANSEGLRFAPDGRVYTWTRGFVRIPLWVPWIAAAGVTVCVWRRPRAPGTCRGCGYSLEGLAGVSDAACPECGKPVATPRK